MMNKGLYFPVLALLFFCLACGSNEKPKAAPLKITSPPLQHVHVVRNVDGDTVQVSDGTNTFYVRFLEIDTPEVYRPRTPIQCYGPEASKFTKQMMPPGTPITLKTDPQLDKIDRYGRHLAYIYVRRVFSNLKIVRSGYAHAYHYLGQRGIYAARFDAAEAYAKSHNLGFWSPKTCNGDTKKPEPPGGFG